jgi:hypothetical protein
MPKSDIFCRVSLEQHVLAGEIGVDHARVLRVQEGHALGDIKEDLEHLGQIQANALHLNQVVQRVVHQL